LNTGLFLPPPTLIRLLPSRLGAGPGRNRFFSGTIFSVPWQKPSTFTFLELSPMAPRYRSPPQFPNDMIRLGPHFGPFSWFFPSQGAKHYHSARAFRQGALAVHFTPERAGLPFMYVGPILVLLALPLQPSFFHLCADPASASTLEHFSLCAFPFEPATFLPPRDPVYLEKNFRPPGATRPMRHLPHLLACYSALDFVPF